MSTEQKQLNRHKITSFWGGDDRGMCVQITYNGGDLGPYDTPTFVQFDLEEAVEVANELLIFIRKEALRRQKLLQEECKKFKEYEKTVFAEVAALPEDLLSSNEIGIKCVLAFCPKS